MAPVPPLRQTPRIISGGNNSCVQVPADPSTLHTGRILGSARSNDSRNGCSCIRHRDVSEGTPLLGCIHGSLGRPCRGTHLSRPDFHPPKEGWKSPPESPDEACEPQILSRVDRQGPPACGVWECCILDRGIKYARKYYRQSAVPFSVPSERRSALFSSLVFEELISIVNCAVTTCGHSLDGDLQPCLTYSVGTHGVQSLDPE